MKIKLKLILLIPIAFIIKIILKSFPNFVEKYYSNGLNKIIIQFISRVTGILPFSLGEILVVTIFIILLFYILIFIFKNFNKNKNLKHEIINFITNFSCFISLIYSLFLILWGFNYQRLPFNEISNLNINEVNSEELSMLCNELIKKANILREHVTVDSQGIMCLNNGYKDVFLRANKGYEVASKIYKKELSGNYGTPKAILLSKMMCYTGITGIYFPYTGEANININIRDYMIPCTTAHEMAHQRGFAREDEANYIAYLTCSMHPDIDFQYSGTMLALIHSMNALKNNDINSYNKLKMEYSPGVLKDLKNDVQFWNKYNGNIEKISDSINNSYLKSNGQNDGVQSYGRMVDLLIAEFRRKYKIYNTKYTHCSIIFSRNYV